ncbi:MAG TPA: SDR family oxidoreductase [Anaerolineales bacterium]|nr:SDR family oxidoreductase [Anaerolineales bacterium]
MIKNYRTALITGTSQGIGPYMAQALAKEGLNLVLAARSASKLEAVADELRATGVQVSAIPTDVTNPQSLTDLVRLAEKEFGEVDVLVNNAGGDPQREFHNFSAKDVEHVIRLNLTSAIELTRLLLPKMLERGRGHIVNISSLGGWIGFPYTEVYSACKTGLVGFTRVLRADYGPRGIGASALVLGVVWGAGQTSRTMQETGLPMPAMAKVFASSPEAVGRALVRTLRHNSVETVVTPGPGGLMKMQMDLFPGLGPVMNKMFGVADLMKKVADFREQERQRILASKAQTW